MAQAAWGDTGQPLDKLDQVPRDSRWEQCAYNLKNFEPHWLTPGPVLPPDSSIISAIGYGASYWSQSGKIDVRLADGTPESFFIKVRQHLAIK